MDVYTFDKSLQERLVEFTEILSSKESSVSDHMRVVPSSQIKSEWSFLLELVIEPVGWQALWKIPRLTCQDLHVHYPTVVVVQVEQVDPTELSALCKIIAVQDEIHLPEKYDVPLIELYPTLNQENSVLDMIGTSTYIDQLRFFYNNLWMPWDCDDDDNVDWVQLHLETRLRLFFDMKRGIVNKDTCDIIRTLIREAKDIHTKITRLEIDFSDDDNDDEDDEQETKCLVDEDKACQLMKLHLRMQKIKTEIDVLENPVMRNLLQRNPDLNNKNIAAKRRESRGRKLEAFFVWHGGSLEETINCLNKITEFLPKDIFTKTSSCLQEALDASQAGDKIIIGEGEHQIRRAGGLEEGGTIRGLSDCQSTVLCAKDSATGVSLLDFSGGEVSLENVSVDLGELQAGILVRKGIVKISGCKIFASNESIVKLGIIVLPEAKLIVENSSFYGLGTAIFVHPTGECVLNNCQFENCVDGIQLQDESRCDASGCKFLDIKEYGIRFESDKEFSSAEHKIGGCEILNNIKDVSFNNCDFKNIGKNNVTIKLKQPDTLPVKQDNAMDTA
ncbi:hypothetical protein HCN44_001577 [Aphidius gifuensis]|uniref:Uncharacterized protein n=1 Tax=Aphidius gifuensis TaxID=684658 RepID=A0A835CQH1_APHGI|nr:protein nessun dorma [Aphidius gifuensis]KAF7992252.1 hypothetical protein HCN44_001577 [Aphidius gifuensis]